MKRLRLPPDTRPKWYEVPENLGLKQRCKERMSKQNPRLVWRNDPSYRWAYSRRKTDQDLEDLGL